MPISISRGFDWRRATRVGCSVIGFAGVALIARAGPLEFGGIFAGKREAVNDALRIGEWETYVTGYAWHLPHGYKEGVRARLNETTWGGGFGRTIDDEDGDRHSVYFMAFADSHHAPQLNFGYAWQRYWRATRNWSVGGGYLAFVFSREDVANHLPIPALLPCASIRYRGIEVIGLFVPRVSRDIKGDVLFVYLRVPFGRTRETVIRR